MNIKGQICNLRLLRELQRCIACSYKNYNARQDDCLSKLVTVAESLSSKLTSSKHHFQDLKWRGINRGFMS